MELRLATVVVCYHPEESLRNNILSYHGEGNAVFVWDNTPGGSTVVKSLQDYGHVRVDCNVSGENKGLPYAYNRIIERIAEEGYTHLMTMDQDSRFEGFEAFLAGIKLVSDDKVGMFVPPINTTDVLDNKIVPHAPQSGCVFDLEMVRKIGMFREDFFIGMVDVEMQLRAQAAGYSIIQVGGCNLEHHIGSERTVKFFGKEVQVSDYSPMRHYYDSRNRILMWHEFPDDYTRKGKLAYFMGRLKVMLKIVLFEKEKVKKVFAIIKGTWNGVFHR